MSEFRERVLPSWWVYAIVAGFILPSAFIIFLPVNPSWGVIVAIVLFLGIAAALTLAAPVLEVTSGRFRAGRAVIPVDALGAATPLDAAAAKLALGTEFDAAAYHLTVPWVRSLVRVEVVDPDDPTTAWVVSTRKSEALIAALVAAQEPATDAQGSSEA